MENVIASPIREFSEKASKCLLEYETLYTSSRLSINEEDYNQFSRLLMDDSASDADDEITDTSHEELNSSTEVYKPRNVYSITDGNKPFTLVIKKQQNSNNIENVSYKSREAQIIVNGGISDEFPLHNFEHVNNNTVETVALAHVSTKEKRQDNETRCKPIECVEGTSTERKTFPLQDFNRFCDVTNKILQMLSDPTISGYEANCESEDEVGNSHRMLKCNGSNVGLEDRVMNQQYGTGFHGKHSVVQWDNIGKMQSSISNMESAALNKNKELNCTTHCASINDRVLDQSCTDKANKLANEDTYSANEYNDVEINKDLHESDSGMESFPKNNCILDYTNNQVLSAHSLQNNDACLVVNHFHGNDLTCNKMKNDAGVHLDDRESNSAVSDVRNAAEEGEHSIKDNEVTENYRIDKESGGGVNNTLEIIDNECEMPLHVVHKVQMETAAENEITNEAFHESLSEETNKQGAFSLDVTENRSKPNANDLTCNKMKNDAGVHLDDRESNSAVSDVRNAEGGEHSIKDNKVTEHYRIGKESDDGISNALEIIENECEMALHVVHKAQMKMAAEIEITGEAFHESLFEETNIQGAFSLDATENRSKPTQTYPRCECVEDLHMHDFDHSEEHTEQRTVVEQSEAEKSASNIKFLNNFGTDCAVLSPQKFENEKIKTEVVNPVSITLEEKENKILESSTDKYHSEAGTSFFESEIPLSNVSSAAVQKEDGIKILEPLGKSNAVSKLETKGKDDRAFPGDSFADDAMDCSYNDSSSCLDRSPLLFSSDEENYYYTEDSVAEDTSKCYESENQAQQERRKLRRLQRALAGVPPPPSVTIPQLDVNEMLKLIKENQKLMKFDGIAEEKEGSPDGKELKRPLTLFCTEEVKNLPWPEAKSCNFYGVQYNNGKLSEELEALYERLRDRYVGCETLSSCNIWFPGISTKAIEKRMRRRNIGQSPGRRLSHLAKRRQAFSSANLLPSVAGSLPTAAARRGCNRLIMVEVKKGDHRTKAKGQPAKKAALNVNNKLQQTKRALFKSPPSGRKKVSSASKNKSSSKKIKREVDRSKVYNSKRALWPSSGMSENTMPDSSSSRQLKRQREESEDEGKLNKFPRRSLFGERDREKEGNNPKVLHANSSNGQVLSQQHKKKLLWAVAETLRTKGVSMNHPSFKTLASSLARKVCSSLPDMSKKREGRTSEFMLQISKEHIDNILKTTALQDKTDLIKV